MNRKTTRTVWLASYPKSGNTWMRMLIANLSAKDAPADINDLPERGGIASARGPFDYLTLIDSGLLTHDEIDVLRPRVYEELARGVADDEYDAAAGCAAGSFRQDARRVYAECQWRAAAGGRARRRRRDCHRARSARRGAVASPITTDQHR